MKMVIPFKSILSVFGFVTWSIRSRFNTFMSKDKQQNHTVVGYIVYFYYVVLIVISQI